MDRGLFSWYPPAMQDQPKPSWLTPRTITHQVNGEYVEFKAVSVKTFTSLENLFSAMTSSIMQLRRTPQLDAGLSQETNRAGETTFMQLPAKIELVQHHDDQRSMAVDRLVKILSTEKLKIAGILLESMSVSMDPNAFLQQCDADTFAQCMEGFFKANEAIFRPFVRVELLTKWLRGEAIDGSTETVTEIERSLAELTQAVKEASPQRSVPGSTSPTPSPFSPAEDTPRPSSTI